jgi:Tfp pilus assembly protein PilF
MAMALVHRGEYHNAQEYLSSVLRMYPDFVEAQHEMGFALAEPNQLELSKPYFARAIELDPANSHFRHGFGSALARSSQLVEAVKQLFAAARLEPSSDRILDDLRKLQAEVLERAVEGNGPVLLLGSSMHRTSRLYG